MAAWELTVYKLLIKPWQWVKSSKERPEEHRVGVMEGPTAETCVQDKPAKQAQRQQRGWGKSSCKIQGEECQKPTARRWLLNRILSKRSQGQWDPMGQGTRDGKNMMKWKHAFVLEFRKRSKITGDRKGHRGQAQEMGYNTLNKKETKNPWVHTYTNE